MKERTIYDLGTKKTKISWLMKWFIFPFLKNHYTPLDETLGGVQVCMVSKIFRNKLYVVGECWCVKGKTYDKAIISCYGDKSE